MEKLDYCVNTIQKIDTCQKRKKSSFYHISISCRGKRIDARISLPIFEGGENPRLTSTSSKSVEDSVFKLLYKIQERLIKGIDDGYINANNLASIFDNIYNSINELDFKNLKINSLYYNIISSTYRTFE